MLYVKPPREVIFPEPHEQMESSSVMCYVFTGQFLPAPIFHRLLAACIARWPLATKKREKSIENQIFCGCGVFQIDDYHKLTLHFSGYIIFMRVTRQGIIDKTPSSKLCIEVREFIAKVLSKLIGYLGHSLKFEESIQCPEYSGESVNSLITVDKLKENAAVRCDFHDNIIESNKFLKFWFEGEGNIDSVDETCLSTSNQTMPEECQTPIQERALPPRKKYHAFFSYASPDIQWVKKIIGKLETDHGFICCEYDRDNTPGTPLLTFAADSIKNANKTVIVMTREAFKSGFVKHEIKMAINHGFIEERNCVVPVLVEDCDIPDYLQVFNYVDARDNSKSSIWWPKLLRALDNEGEQVICMFCRYIFLMNGICACFFEK
ncbi:hypothetical protein ACJMK2_000119 [Sinanodonta woodiana]|uniref:TIR domain-containing protein n=1 Tax=Sinanodonta woodiana TaxID=1069815 RepID=A0ABD3XQ37_SINWO